MSGYSFAIGNTEVKNKRFFYRVIGYLLLSLSAAQFITMVVSFVLHDRSFWNFLLAAAITGSVGAGLIMRSGAAVQLKKRYLFLLTTLCWLSICLFAAIRQGR